jgi:uncharacterized protein YaiL (DUF2058 family)
MDSSMVIQLLKYSQVVVKLSFLVGVKAAKVSTIYGLKAAKFSAKYGIKAAKFSAKYGIKAAKFSAKYGIKAAKFSAKYGFKITKISLQSCLIFANKSIKKAKEISQKYDEINKILEKDRIAVTEKSGVW